MSEKIRLQKLLSQKGLFSRRECEDLIRKGRITINEKVAQLGDRANSEDIIAVDGEVIDMPQKIKRVVLAYYKPRGMETTMARGEGDPTIGDLDFGVGRVFPVGRLDKDSHGLLLLTNDGELANRLAHPRHQKEKEYLVSVKTTNLGIYESKNLGKVAQKLEKGIVMEDGKKTAPCKVQIIDGPTIRPASSAIRILKFTLKEGRNRQIRRMCEAVGLEVTDLLRTRIGKLELGQMKEGKWRILSEVEIGSL